MTNVERMERRAELVNSAVVRAGEAGLVSALAKPPAEEVVLQLELRVSAIKAAWAAGHRHRMPDQFRLVVGVGFHWLAQRAGHDMASRHLDDERAYQDQGAEESRFAAAQSPVGELLLLEKYVGKARQAWCDNAGDSKARTQVMKVVAIAVRALENSAG